MTYEDVARPGEPAGLRAAVSAFLEVVDDPRRLEEHAARVPEALRMPLARLIEGLSGYFDRQGDPVYSHQLRRALRAWKEAAPAPPPPLNAVPQQATRSSIRRVRSLNRKHDIAEQRVARLSADLQPPPTPDQAVPVALPLSTQEVIGPTPASPESPLEQPTEAALRLAQNGSTLAMQTTQLLQDFSVTLTQSTFGEREIVFVTSPVLIRVERWKPPSLPLRRSLIIDRPEACMAVLALLRDNSTVAIQGMPGFGKSVLAQLVAHQGLAQGQFPAGVIFERIGRRVRSKEDVLNILRRWISYGYMGDFSASRVTPEEVRGALDNHGALLIVLDDVDDGNTPWLKPLIEAMPPDARLLITTRSRPLARRDFECHIYPLQRFHPEEALELFGRYLAQSAGDWQSAARKLYPLLDGHPMLLRAAASRLAGRPSDTWAATIEAIAHSVAEGDAIDLTDDEQRLWPMIGQYLTSLDDITSLRFGMLSVLAPGIDFDALAASWIWSCEGSEADQQLGRLADAGLLDSDARRPYWRQYPALYGFARTMLDDQAFGAALADWIDMCLAHLSDQEAARSDWILWSLPHLNHVLTAALVPDLDRALALIERSGGALVAHGETRLVCDWSTSALQAARRTADIDSIVRAARLFIASQGALTAALAGAGSEALELALMACEPNPEAPPAVRGVLTCTRAQILILLALHSDQQQGARLVQATTAAEQALADLDDGNEFYSTAWFVHAIARFQTFEFFQDSQDEDTERLLGILDAAIACQMPDSVEILALQMARGVIVTYQIERGGATEVELLDTALAELRSTPPHAVLEVAPLVVTQMQFVRLALLTRRCMLDDPPDLERIDAALASAETVMACAAALRKSDADLAALFEGWSRLFLAALITHAGAAHSQGWVDKALTYLAEAQSAFALRNDREALTIVYTLRLRLRITVLNESSDRVTTLEEAAGDAYAALVSLPPNLADEGFQQALWGYLYVLALLAEAGGIAFARHRTRLDEITDAALAGGTPEANKAANELLVVRATLFYSFAEQIESETQKEWLIAAYSDASRAIDQGTELFDWEYYEQATAICAIAALRTALWSVDDWEQWLGNTIMHLWMLWRAYEDRGNVTALAEVQAALQGVRGLAGDSFERLWLERGYGAMPAWLSAETEVSQKVACTLAYIRFVAQFEVARRSGRAGSWRVAVRFGHALDAFSDAALPDLKRDDIHRGLAAAYLAFGIALAREASAAIDWSSREARLADMNAAFEQAAALRPLATAPAEHMKVRTIRSLTGYFILAIPEPVVAAELRDILRLNNPANIAISDRQRVAVLRVCAEIFNQLLVIEDLSAAEALVRELEQINTALAGIVPAIEDRAIEAQIGRAEIAQALADAPRQSARGYLHESVAVCEDMLTFLPPDHPAYNVLLLQQAQAWADLALCAGEDRHQCVTEAVAAAWEVMIEENEGNERFRESAALLMRLRVEHETLFADIWRASITDECPPNLIDPSEDAVAYVLGQAEGRFLLYRLLASQRRDDPEGWYRATAIGEVLLLALDETEETSLSATRADIADAYRGLGLAYEVNSNFKGALAAMTRAEAIEPGHAETASYRQRILDSLIPE